MLEELMAATKAVAEDVLLYNGDSFLIPLFLIALLFLWVTEKDRKVRVVLLYLVAALVVVFLCPVYAWIGMKIDQDVYYRVLWSLPVGVLVCYSAVRLMTRFRQTDGCFDIYTSRRSGLYKDALFQGVQCLSYPAGGD